MDLIRRELLKLAGFGLTTLVTPALLAQGARAQTAPMPDAGPGTVFDVRTYGAVGDGKAIDTAAINRAIEAAAAKGGGTVFIPAGSYACYSIHLKSSVALYLDEGATILAAETPHDGTSSGYDFAESNAPWEAYQDFGHNHWHNSLIWGEGLHDIAILGPGLIWGKGLSRGHDDPDLPRAEAQGTGNKAIALKNCRNVILRDFAMLAGGHFAILATGVDNLSIDNVRIDTNRDGIDIDCCRNVRVSNCSVNAPWDDAIVPKSSFALGHARITENVTIANCYVTGDYQLGTLLDSSFKRFPDDWREPHGWQRTGRIKCGTESNGAFRNIAISNCIFEGCRGLALETVDGGILEDVSVTGLTMRDIRNAPLFLRLGARMRGPKEIPIGRLKRVLISNVTCYAPQNDMPAIISGIPGHAIEDVKISDCYFLQQGGGGAETAALQPVEEPAEYPEPARFGALPAQHFYLRHVSNIELSHVELQSTSPDARAALWLDDVKGADFSHLKLPPAAPSFLLNDAVVDFRISQSRGIKDVAIDTAPASTRI